MNSVHSIKKIFKNFGFEIKRYSVTQNQQLRLLKLLNNYKIDLVFDVGANKGQFGQELRGIGYFGEIVSFEPLFTPFNTLSDISRNDSDWHIERCAVGDIDGEIEINIAGNSASSSIREMLPSHYNAAPDSSYVGIEKVEIFKLDSIAKKYKKNGSNIFLKIDTQGYEENVIIGAKDLIDDLKMIQMELSLIELYQGQKLLIEMLEVMRDKGFTLWNLDPAFINPINGQMLQLDAVFVKT